MVDTWPGSSKNRRRGLGYPVRPFHFFTGLEK